MRAIKTLALLLPLAWLAFWAKISPILAFSSMLVRIRVTLGFHS